MYDGQATFPAPPSPLRAFALQLANPERAVAERYAEQTEIGDRLLESTKANVVLLRSFSWRTT